MYLYPIKGIESICKKVIQKREKYMYPIKGIESKNRTTNPIAMASIGIP